MSADKRKQEDIEYLVDYIKVIPFFKERQMNDKSLIEVVQSMTLLEKEGGEMIMEYGDVGENFYFILEG